MERRYRYIVPLTGTRTASRTLLGGKGYNLHRLVEGNFHVPTGFVITTLAYREALRDYLASIHLETLPEEFSGLISGLEIPDRIQNEILAAAGTLRQMTGGALVVRSSATSEDQASGSMAGQNASFVNILTDEQLTEAVRGCWASLFSRESIAYRAQMGRTPDIPEMAVVVQQLIPASKAGVLFTVDPVTGDDERMVLSASWGLGETVVGGRAADNLVLDRESGSIVEHEIAHKDTMLVPNPVGETQEVKLSGNKARQPVVDDHFAARLHSLALRAETLFGAPQDLEWAQWRDRVYLLQARPITGHRNPASRQVWSNANVGEALPGVGTPYTWSVIREFSRRGLVHAFRGLGCSVPEEYAIVGSVRGRVYLNLSEFMSVASQIPFITPQILLQVAGGGGVEDLPGTFRRLSPVGFLSKLPLTSVLFLARRVLIPARVGLWSQQFKAFRGRFESINLGTLGDRALLELHRETEKVFNDTGTLMLEYSGQFLAAYLATSIVLRRVLGDRAEKLERELFSGLSGVQSAEPGLDLLRMARQVRQSETLTRLVLETPPNQLLSVLQTGEGEPESLNLAIEAFLESHGHRAVREAELSEPRWRDDPGFPLSMLQKYVEATDVTDPTELVKQRIQARKQVTRRVLNRIPTSIRPMFRKLLKESQEAARTREDLRNWVVHTMGFYRRLALEVGRRMADRHVLANPHLGFFLRRSEHLDYLKGRDAQDLGVRALMRYLEREALSELPDPPPTFVMKGDRIVAPETLEVTGKTQLSGLPGSPGRATGKVVVLRDPSLGKNLNDGDILVAPFTDVGWTPLFLVAGAVVTELGGPLSHSCVVAREYGVPAVVNVPGATQRLKDGQLVTVDGDHGTIEM